MGVLRKASFLSLLLILTSPVFSDEIETLIRGEQRKLNQWADISGDLPVGIFVGDETGIQIYSESFDRKNSNLLCEPLDFDELGSKSATVNIKHPRIQSVLAKSCLVRPGDVFLAVGPGWQKFVSVQAFVLKKEKPVCRNGSDKALWVSFNEKLPGSPLFFSTDIELDEGANGFRKTADLETVQLSKADLKRMETVVPFFNEYEATSFEVNAPNCEALTVLKRKKVSPHDDGLSNAVLLWKKAEILKTLVDVRVDLKRGSGHLYLEHVFDFNNDGFIDILVRRDEKKCSFRSLYVGQVEGFKRIAFPNRSCTCS